MTKVDEHWRMVVIDGDGNVFDDRPFAVTEDNTNKFDVVSRMTAKRTYIKELFIEVPGGEQIALSGVPDSLPACAQP